jgi:tetratricopeptide (TPR) repeat protein
MAEISVDRAFEIAVAHYRAGRWAEAEGVYRQILVRIPDNVVVMHQLGILLAQQESRREEAVQLLTRVVQLQPNNAEAHNDLGNALRDVGRLNEAATALSRAVALKPELALAHANLGNVLRDLGRLDEAIEGLGRAIQIKPDFAAAYSNLGNALFDKGQMENAVGAFRRAIQLDPGFAAAHSNLGVALESLHRSEEAAAAFQRAIELAPDYAEAHSNLGRSLESLGRLDAAIAAHERAVQLKPDLAPLLCNLGNALQNNKQVERAIAVLRRAVGLQPQFAEAHNNLANALSDRGDVDEAIASYRQALRLKPDYADAMSNLAGALIDRGKLDEPEGLLRRAIEVDPQCADAHWNLAIFLLLHGDFERGLLEYEWRWKVKSVVRGSPKLLQAPWDGRELDGQTILLHTEQGIGDAIQFIRYAPMVAARGGQIILRCPIELKRLFAAIPEIERIVDLNERLPEFDVHCPLMSLPLAFKTDLNSIPATVPYLRADPALAEAWKEKLASWVNVRKIGLAWSGAAIHSNDRNRSTTLSSLAPLAEIEDVVYFSLQKGEATKQPRPEGLAISDFTADLNDFADTAALIGNLDLVITVDTSVAHLAGAMGKPVWVLLPSNPDWRWMYDRADSPWYPTMRLFRQGKAKDWAAVLDKVTRQLMT